MVQNNEPRHHTSHNYTVGTNTDKQELATQHQGLATSQRCQTINVFQHSHLMLHLWVLHKSHHITTLLHLAENKGFCQQICWHAGCGTMVDGNLVTSNFIMKPQVLLLEYEIQPLLC